MQYENIATVRLLIIAEIYGLPDAELSCSVQICNFSRHSSRKRSTTRQLLDIAPNLAVPRQDGGKQMLFETSYGVRRYLEPSLRCFLPRCFFSPYKFPIQKTGALEAYGRITNRWPGGSARPPDTRRASVFALQDTVRVSASRTIARRSAIPP